ncbi:MAG: hypothetical protein DI529_14830 [Chryseobacterium sp.]|nr:MAG: hypothetical protein DI529_14830 [Chryseobacterium sp.]
MTKKGQIVEIPASSPIYSTELPIFHSKKEELIWKSLKKEYSLFNGFLVGEHHGTQDFKLGQRKGINVGGKKAPLYVIAIDELDNRIFVGAGEDHAGLFSDCFHYSNNQIEWVSEKNNLEILLQNGISVEIESSAFEDRFDAKLYIFDNDFFLEFEKPISITIQNYLIEVFYQDSLIIKIQ